jgi:hypothetical protein
MRKSNLSKDELIEYAHLVNKRKNARFTFRLTDEERQRYEALAVKHGVRPSAMIREKLLSTIFFKGVNE